MKKISFILLALPLLLEAQQADVIDNMTLQTIAFGSCSRQYEPENQLWQEINATDPDLWVWLGDNIYGDSEDMEVLRAKYEQQKSHAGYQQLIQRTPVIGIWDDHDFGVNDGGKEFTKKDESKLELFRFLGVDPSHPARLRQGAYQSYTYQGDQNVKFILLDARYFRDPLKKDEHQNNQPDPEGEILGADQWEWLEAQLQDPTVDLFLVASGIQVIPEEHRFEKWANFPSERQRLFDLIATVSKPLVLLSGDRHISEVSKIELPGYRYPLYEFTSSSLTSPWGKTREEPNRFREKQIVYERNFALLDLTFNRKELELEVTYYGQNQKVIQTHAVTFQR